MARQPQQAGLLRQQGQRGIMQYQLCSRSAVQRRVSSPRSLWLAAALQQAPTHPPTHLRTNPLQCGHPGQVLLWISHQERAQAQGASSGGEAAGQCAWEMEQLLGGKMWCTDPPA